MFFNQIKIINQIEKKMKLKKAKTISSLLQETIEYKSKVDGVSQSRDLMVDINEQRALIERLSSNINDEDLYFVVKIEDLSIVEAKGFEFLGYNSSEFTKSDQVMAKIALPGFIDLILMFQRRLLDFFKLMNSDIKFNCPGFAIQFPVYNSNNQVVLMKCTTKVFQYTVEKSISHLLYQMTLIKTKYDNEPLEPRLINSKNESIMLFKDLLGKGFIWESSTFSPKEIIIMKEYVKNPDININNLSKEMNTTYETLKTYNKQIILKSKSYLGPLFTLKNAKDIAIFFNNCGVI